MYWERYSMKENKYEIITGKGSIYYKNRVVLDTSGLITATVTGPTGRSSDIIEYNKWADRITRALHLLDEYEEYIKNE